MCWWSGSSAPRGQEELAIGAVARPCRLPEVTYPFPAIGNWYLDFDQVSDEEVRVLLREAAIAAEAGPSGVGQ